MMDMSKYTASTLSFTAATKTIADSAKGLKHFQAGDTIQVTGSTSNNGYYTVATGNTVGSIITTEALVNESAGQAVVIKVVTDQKDDARLESVVEATSRWIDSETGTRFYTVSETRYYLAEQDWLIDIDYLVSLTSVKTDPNGDGTYTYTWAGTDYTLSPYNAVVSGQPYTHLETTPLGAYRFPVYPSSTTRRSRVEVTGAFGYSTLANVPRPIKEACILMSIRLFQRKDKPFGISGSADLGTLEVITAVGKDDEIKRLLRTVKRRAIA